jgi:hypothetical protein
MRMTLLWFITGASLVVAVVAWRLARRTAQRLEQLTQMYWELKYQHGELRVRLQRDAASAPSPDEVLPPPPAGDAFIPLTSLKR